MPSPVFIYSGFRTSSTWVWKKFRDLPGAHAYYEIYNGILAGLDGAVLSETAPGGWDAYHPNRAPYFLEFAPLLSPGAKGVPRFSPRFEYGNMIPRPGLETLDPDERAYLEGLMEVARNCDKTPVFTCSRNLGRIGATKAAFPGVHLVTVRNLWFQWLSFCHQHFRGNDFFLKTVGETLRGAEDDPFLSHVAARFDTSPPDSPEEAPGESLFHAFVASQLYLYAIAFKYADLVVDVNRLADDSGYREKMQAEVRSRTGLAVDFSDVGSKIEYGPTPVPSEEVLRANLESFYAAIFNHPELAASATAKAGVRSLIEGLCAEIRRYDFYTHSESTCLRSYFQKVAELKSEAVVRDASIADLRRQLHKVPFHTHFYRGFRSLFKGDPDGRG